MGNSYRLEDAVVCSYQGNKYISVPKNGATITKIEDIGDVDEEDLADNTFTVKDAEVIGVQSLGTYWACVACKSKVTPSTTGISSCSKCGLAQRTDHCKEELSAKLYTSTGNGAEYLTLNIFGNNVRDIAQKNDITVESLLCAKPFTLVHDQNVITNIERC